MKDDAVVNHTSIVGARDDQSVSIPATKTRVLIVVALFVLVAHGVYQWQQLHSAKLETFTGYARMVEDPIARFGGMQVVLNIEGKRYLALAHSVAGRAIAQGEAGNVVYVEGERTAVKPEMVLRYAPRHIVGMFAVSFVHERMHVASPLARSANRLRATMQQAADVMPRSESALFMGLVIGDDRAQPRTMVNAFRQAGLSHLTAVSGQNVAFVLTVFGVYLRRTRTWWRFGLSVALVAWFVVLTRAEPSVLRAATMASFGAYAYAKGRDASGATTLLYSVYVLLLVDPMLTFSVGFWMSSFATGGLIFVTPKIIEFVQGPLWVAQPLATTLGAQAGVVPITLLVFGNAPAISVVTNVLAVPVAGFVMLIGLPTALFCGVAMNIAGSAVQPLCELLMLPIQMATRWVWWVAVIGENFSPSGLANVVLWLLWAILLVVLHRYGRLQT